MHQFSVEQVLRPFFFLGAFMFVAITYSVVTGARAPALPSEGRMVPAAGTNIAPFTSGVAGTVSRAPVCPVQPITIRSGCGPIPYPTRVQVRRLGADRAFVRGETGTDGWFAFALPAGTYVLSAFGGDPFPRCLPVSVTVSAAGYAWADLTCDTGIR